MPATYPIRHIVAHVNDEDVSRHALQLAAALAAQFDASLEAVAVVPPATSTVAISPEAGALAQQAEQAERTRLRDIAERLVSETKARCGRAIELQVRAADVVDCLLARSRTADLLVVGQRPPAGSGGLSAAQAGRVLVGAGGPVLTVPHIGLAGGEGAPARPLRRALVAWAETRESARALHDALPLLVRAEHVELVSFHGHGGATEETARAQLAAASAHLGRHGVATKASLLTQREPSISERLQQRGWVPDVSVAEALLSNAADMQADFIVMGGYGHARLWELMLGGVTRMMLQSMTVPVLMSH